MTDLHIELFSGYRNESTRYLTTDVHVCDEQGRTKKVFPAPPNGNSRGYASLDRRIELAKDWIKIHA